jgi:hypothetical protein
MDRALEAHSETGALTLRRRFDTDAVLAWLLPGVLVIYLGLRGGGYDQIINSQVAIAAWWLIFLIVAFRLAVVRTSTAGLIWLGLLFAYAAWTTLSLTWTVSRGNTMVDVSLMALYSAVAVLAMCLRGRDAPRHMLHALGVGIVVIAFLAVLSRLRFEWFAQSQTAEFLVTSTQRLSYPLNYWNGLAALMAIGIPVLLYAATGARSLLARSLAGASLPLLALCAFLTGSRGGVLEIGIGLAMFVLLVPDRVHKLAVIAAGVGGGALVIAAANQRTAVREGMRTALAGHQGNQLVVITIVAAIAVGLLVAAITLVERHVELPALLRPTRRRATQLSLGGLLACVLVFLVAGGPHFVSHEWNQFKNTARPANFSESDALARLQNASGEGRYQYWQAAVAAADKHPLTGTGAGTFVFWWAQHGSLAAGYVKDAHSFYMQSLGELGYPGLIISVGLIAWILISGVARVIRGRDPAMRLALATATAGATAFAFAIAIDWIWLIPVLPVVLIVLAAVIFSPKPEADPEREAETAKPVRARSSLGGVLHAPVLSIAARVAAAVASLVVIVGVALPMAATADVRDSQSLVGQGKLPAALSKAVDAVHLEPYAAAPRLQEALVLEQAGDLPDALAAAKQATARENTNWQNWIVLSRLEARNGHAVASTDDYERAETLDPLAPIFNP